jgi:hypothetical protein
MRRADQPAAALFLRQPRTQTGDAALAVFVA